MRTTIVALSLTIIAFVFLVHRSSEKPSYVDGPLYEWTEAADHHTAVVKVNTDNSGGSGVYVLQDDMEFVLTAAHVIGRSGLATVTFSDGETVQGRTLVSQHYTGSGSKHDLAAILVTSTTIAPVSISSESVSSVEICGFGGPEHRLRHFTANASVDGDVFRSDGRVVNGDSGGGWFADGKLVGISSAGSSEPIAQFAGGKFNVYDSSVSASPQWVADFGQRVHDKYCQT